MHHNPKLQKAITSSEERTSAESRERREVTDGVLSSPLQKGNNARKRDPARYRTESLMDGGPHQCLPADSRAEGVFFSKVIFNWHPQRCRSHRFGRRHKSFARRDHDLAWAVGGVVQHDTVFPATRHTKYLRFKEEECSTQAVWHHHPKCQRCAHPQNLYNCRTCTPARPHAHTVRTCASAMPSG